MSHLIIPLLYITLIILHAVQTFNDTIKFTLVFFIVKYRIKNYLKEISTFNDFFEIAKNVESFNSKKLKFYIAF